MLSILILGTPLEDFSWKIINVKNVEGMIWSTIHCLMFMATIFCLILFWTDESKNQKILDILKVYAAGCFSLLVIIVSYIESLAEKTKFGFKDLQLDGSLSLLYKCFLVLNIFIFFYLAKIGGDYISHKFNKST